VARTLEEVGNEPTMALATATRQDGVIDAMAARGVTYPRGEPFSWRSFVDALGAGTTPHQQQNITRGKS
jgi:hypothetical protein